MPIPTNEMMIITNSQGDLLSIKNRLSNLIASADAMYDLKPGDMVARTACLDAKGGARELLGLVEQYHASLSRALMVSYGVDAGPIILGGGGGRR